MQESPLHTRLKTATIHLNYRRIADLTQTSPESVRRYMQGRPPSTQFLAAICRSLGINAHWLLTGQGPMQVTQITPAALQEADAAELLQALADTLTDLIDRVDRLERMTQQFETLVRASGMLVEAKPEGGKGLLARSTGQTARQAAQQADGDAAGRIGRAVARRSPAADDPAS